MGRVTGVGKVHRYVSLYVEHGPRVRVEARGQAGSTAEMTFYKKGLPAPSRRPEFSEPV